MKQDCPIDPELPGILCVSRKHHYMESGLSRFAWVTVGRRDGNPWDNPMTPLPLFVLNGSAMKRLSDEDLAVMDAARSGIRDTEKELDWRGESHFLIQLQGLIVDGIDAKSARIAAAAATRDLIAMQGGGWT